VVPGKIPLARTLQLISGPRCVATAASGECAMTITNIHRHAVDLSEPTMRALRLLCRLDDVTPERFIDRLVMEFLDLRWDEIEDAQRTPAPRRRRAPARVIDLAAERSRRRVAAGRAAFDVHVRSRALRDYSLLLRARSLVARRKCDLALESWPVPRATQPWAPGAGDHETPVRMAPGA
jgi:hypothetical protein